MSNGRVYRGPETARPTAAWTCPRCHTPGTTFDEGCAMCGFNRGPKGYRAEPGGDDEQTEEQEHAPVTPKRRVAPIIERDSPPQAREEATDHVPDVVTVYKLIEYRGPREWVEATLAKSLHGRMSLGDDKHLTATEVSIMPGTVFHQAITAAAQQPDHNFARRALQPAAATPETHVRALQFWQQQPDGEYALVEPRVVTTITAALLHFADDAQPQGDDLSLSQDECVALVEALRRGHQL